MKSLRAGQLVTVTGAEHSADAIITDTSGLPRVVVVAADAEGQAEFRTVLIGQVKTRRDAGPHDQALRALISAASSEARAGAPGSGGNLVGSRAAHSAPRMHRPTGR